MGPSLFFFIYYLGEHFYDFLVSYLDAVALPELRNTGVNIFLNSFLPGNHKGS